MGKSHRGIRIDKLSITHEEYMELMFFCRQYHRKKRRAEDLLTMSSSAPKIATDAKGNSEFMPRGRGGVSDPVARIVEKREKLLADVRMIDCAAEQAAGEFAPYILRDVTTKEGVCSILRECPCGRNQFYALRRKFFCILWELKNEISSID